MLYSIFTFCLGAGFALQRGTGCSTLLHLGVARPRFPRALTTVRIAALANLSEVTAGLPRSLLMGHVTRRLPAVLFRADPLSLDNLLSDYNSQDLEYFFGTYLKMSKARLCVFCMQNPNLLVRRLMGLIQMTGFVLHDMPEEGWG